MENNISIIVGIDASRNRSGGAIAHLNGILTSIDPRVYGVKEVHVWAYKSLIDSITDFPWLEKHAPAVLEKSLLRQIWWQYKKLPKEAREYGCDILFNTDAGSVCPFKPAVTLSQDLLSYEPLEMRRYGLSKAKLRLEALRFIQSHSMLNANGVIFLTKYAAKVVQDTIGILNNSSIIPHGVGDNFRLDISDIDSKQWPFEPSRGIHALYVSNAEMYKHQWHVINAVGQIRKKGINISLLLVGGGRGRPQKLIDREISNTDPKMEFIQQRPFVAHDTIPELLKDADLFVFASSCETIGITLLEAMAAGLPIACSDRGPMPEVLQDGGVYFNPENSSSIADAVAKIIKDQELRIRIAKRAKELSGQYTWKRCADETWKFIAEVAKKTKNSL